MSPVAPDGAASTGAKTSTGVRMRFDNVQILSVAHVDAPHPVASDEIESRLAATMQRLGVPSGMLERFSGIKSRRHFDEEKPWLRQPASF